MRGQYTLTNISLSLTLILAFATDNNYFSQLLFPLAQKLYYPFVMPYEWLIIGGSASERTVVGILLAAVLASINAAAIWFQVKNHHAEYENDYRAGLFPDRTSIMNGFALMLTLRSADLYFSMNNPASGMITTSRDLGRWQLLYILSIPSFVLLTSFFGALIAMFFAVPNLSKTQGAVTQPFE